MLTSFQISLLREPRLIKLVLVAFLLFALSLPAFTTTRAVNEGDLVMGAIQASAAGDTILIQPGNYQANLVIDRSLTLIGIGKPAVLGGYEGNVVHVLAPHTSLDGLHVSESGTRLTKDMATILIEADSVTIRNCLVTEPLHGIYVKGASAITLIGNRIEGRVDLIESDRGNGIHLWNTARNRVIDNEILNVRDGIYFSFADSTEITNNHIHHVRYGLHYMYSNYNTFVENRFEENVAGAALMYSNNIKFTKNVFARCRGFRAYGILFQSMDSTEATGNLIIDNSRGLFLNNSDTNLFTGNDVVDNDLAMQLNGGCDENRIYGNNFVGNLSDLILDVSDKGTSWNMPGDGNYWTSYRGYDLSADGVGDVPHSIQQVFQVMETKVPEIRFYLFSPASELLEIAERALPILDLGKAKDQAPHIRQLAHDDVPWESVETNMFKSSRAGAGLYLLLSVLPIVGLLRWSGGRRKQ